MATRGALGHRWDKNLTFEQVKPIHCKVTFEEVWPMAGKLDKTFEGFKTKLRLFAVLPTLLNKLVRIHEF